MSNPETIEIHGLSTIHKLCKFGADHNMEGCSFTEIVERMFAELAKSQTMPESTGLTDANGKLIFVGDTVEFIGGCMDFLDLSGYGSPKYVVNKGDQMIVRKLKSGYTLSLPWIDCDTPNRIGNLGNYDFWNIHRDFIVIEALEQNP